MGKVINNHYFKLVISCILSGIIMGIAGFELIAMKAENHTIIGGFLQGFGLLTILYFGLYSFPGHFTDIFYKEKKINVLIDQIIAVIVNIVAIIGTAYMFRLMSNHNEKLINAAIELAETRLITVRTIVGKQWYMTLISGITCGLVIGIGTYIYKRNIHPLLKAFTIFFIVGLYVVCGFENILTNNAYIAFANMWNASTSLNLFIVFIGNFIGITSITLLLNHIICKEEK